ncbi:MAG: hypothetical protein H7249_04885 [Chitinophagaceae bacterium]|nr:hypothetical protein [Oligoflexus sp.]
MQQPAHRKEDAESWFLIDSIWGAFKRHSVFAGLVCLPIALLIVYSLAHWRPEYSSTATIVYDMSKVKEGQAESSLVLGNRVAATFTSRFADPEFLNRLYERLETKGIHAPVVLESKIKLAIKSVLPVSLLPGTWADPADPNDKHVKVDELLKRLVIATNANQFTLSVTGVGNTPYEAQTYAREAIDFYVEEDLKKFSGQLEEQLEQLNSLESSTLLEKADSKDIARTQAFVQEEGVPATEGAKKAMKSEEQALIAKILAKQKEAVRNEAIQYEREFQLQSELNALLSKRGAAHPEVIQKRTELERFKADLEGAKTQAAITKLKGDLYTLQAQMRGQGISIDRSVQLNSFSDEVRRYLLDVSNQIRTIELEIENVNSQLQDPSKWTRYNLVREPELPSKASNVDKLLLSIAVGLALLLICFVMIVFVREFNYPWIVEAKGLPRRYRLPVLANVPAVRTFLNVEKVRALRARLGDLRKSSDPELKLLDSYRYLQQVLKSKGDPQVICFYDIGGDKVSAHAALNLANVMATDSNERVIYLSFNPANQKFLPGGEGGNLMSFLSGEIDWKSCRVKANEEIACDLAVAEHPELQLGHFREDLVQRLIKALREKYQRIIIDGLNPVFMNENTMLAKESDVILVGTTLGSSKHTDLERLLSVTDPAKVQGFVLG